ncbi:hypothetical protein [Streptomyces sp. S1D4-20]|uniref:hypothetical protein n=1 Tax=Streptomyces sp. S1D4-20 TaxID=2594462 RepID=UPI001164404E|nr:hypothetical protein [Streptomyces sp. S1D4-20]QDN54288.1 hypothetical protein FNV67_01635 [Streptomyces sp. S1D4-20]
MTETSTYVADGIAAGLSTYPHPRPVMDTGALAEAVRVQLGTWVTAGFGIPVPSPEVFAAAPAESVSRLLAEVAERSWGAGADGDAEAWGVAHLFYAHAESLYAAQGRGDAYLLGALYSLIVARAHLRDGYEGRFELSPFDNDRRTINETALIETIRVQLATWAPATFGTVVQIPDRWEMRTAADLSDFIADVTGTAEAKYGDMDDDSVRGMAHLANARAHGLKAGYGHGDAYVFAALRSLVLAAANLA